MKDSRDRWAHLPKIKLSCTVVFDTELVVFEGQTRDSTIKSFREDICSNPRDIGNWTDKAVIYAKDISQEDKRGVEITCWNCGYNQFRWSTLHVQGGTQAHVKCNKCSQLRTVHDPIRAAHVIEHQCTPF